MRQFMGGFMNKTFYITIISLFFFMACHDDGYRDHYLSSLAAENDIEEIVISVKEDNIKQNNIKDINKDEVNNTHQDILIKEESLSALPEKNYRSVYDNTIYGDNSDIMPWHVNYLNSYGMMPTRYSHGPSFYSFTIKAKNDYYSGPIDFDDHYDDD